MLTYMDRARRLWTRYGRITRAGRVYLRDEYIGRIDYARGIARARGMSRAVVLVTVDPVDVVAHWLM